MNKKARKKLNKKNRKNKFKVCSISDVVHAVAKIQQLKKSIMVHILEKDIGPVENILKDSSIKYSRTKVNSDYYRLELFATQEKRKSLDDMVSDFMSQFEDN